MKVLLWLVVSVSVGGLLSLIAEPAKPPRIYNPAPAYQEPEKERPERYDKKQLKTA